MTATVTVTTARLEEPHADGGELLVTLGGTATSASDYAAVTTAEATLNFAVADFAETDVNGTNLYRATKTVTTTVVDDEDQEDAETIVFTLGAVTSGTSPTAAAISLGTSSATATISASDQPAASTDASLSGLSLSAGALVPGFGSDIFEYTADVDYAAHQITVTPAKNHGSATVEFLYSSDAAIDDANDDVEGQQVNLNVGSKVIKIKVTAEDGATILTYSVTVTRATPEVSISSVGFDTEGDAAVFIVSRNVAVPEELTVAIFVSETGNMVPAGSGGAGQRTVRIRNGQRFEKPERHHHRERDLASPLDRDCGHLAQKPLLDRDGRRHSPARGRGRRFPSRYGSPGPLAQPGWGGRSDHGDGDDHDHARRDAAPGGRPDPGQHRQRDGDGRRGLHSSHRGDGHSRVRRQLQPSRHRRRSDALPGQPNAEHRHS